MADTINTWATFASKIIDALRQHDVEYGTGYAYELDNAKGREVLARIMAKVDRASAWEPVPTSAILPQKKRQVH